MRFREIDTNNREDWLEWRKGGIGSSDVPAIMGVSRFSTYQELLMTKAGIWPKDDTKNKWIKEKGQRIETFVRDHLIKSYGNIVIVNCQMKRIPFLRASLDGITEDRKTIFEIKLLSRQKTGNIIPSTEGYGKWLKVRDKQEIPVDYYPQVQHQLWVTGAKRCLFVGFREVSDEFYMSDEKLAIAEVLPDRKYIKKMVRKQIQFWNELQQLRKQLEYKGELE